MYAIIYAIDKQKKQDKLRAFYVAAGPIINREIPSHANGLSRIYDEVPLQQFLTDAENWERDTSTWLGANLGPAAKERFLDMSQIQTICWTKDVNGCDSRYDIPRNRLTAEKKNLSAIMETSAYDQ